MRIIAGEFRGRRIDAPPGRGTRPTTDRVRESLFSALVSLLGPELGGGAVLDAFAGSGALGLEAVSRGASGAVLVERDRKALATCKSNVAALGVSDRVRVLGADVFSLAKAGIAGGPFALILLDAPYTLDQTALGGLLAELARAGNLEPGAAVTWEHAAGDTAAWPEGFEAVARKRYGTTEIEFAVWEGGDDL